MSRPISDSISRRTFLIRAGGMSLIAGTAGALAAETWLAPPADAASFGYSDDGTHYVVNTGANLVFKVDHTNGDLTSLVYNSVEYQGYAGTNSQVESGLGASTVTIAQSGTVIVISVVHGTLHHYYVARSGENNIYMFTNKADDSVTATRYIVRHQPGLFPEDTPDSWLNADTVIEAADIFEQADGTTRAKHYSNLRVIDYDYVGRANSAVGIWMVRSNHEKASGGPFYRSLLRHLNDSGGGIYEILYYGENQTEAERFGLQGPYILAFTSGGAPSSTLYHANLDTSWIDGLGLAGWVGASGRGRVAGVGISGMASGYAYTVGFANSAAQYWASASSSTGYYSCPNMLPGTYTQTVYKGELAVWTGSVTVTAGAVSALNTITIAADPSDDAVVWRIGEWDGTTSGFKNAAQVLYMHPSDPRLSAWTGSYAVGSAQADFPCYQWNGVNNGLTVTFTLTAAQAAATHTLRIGITTAYLNGRPQVTVNSWTSAIPSPATEPSTRSLTVGSYRGNNHTYTYAIPATAFVTGTNTLTLNIVSGDSGTEYLSPGVAYDCLDLLA